MTADPLSVQCPSCLAPPQQACRTDHGTHADRQDSADLHAVEHGTCDLCGHPMVRGVPQVGTEVTAWHPDPTHAAVCPPLPDPRTDWDNHARALQQGLAPGYPGLHHFIAQGAVLPEPRAIVICRDCMDGKHAACNGLAWDPLTEDTTTCGCTNPQHPHTLAGERIHQ